MTAGDPFTAEEWKLVSQGPTSAGMIVITAQRGGTIRETFSMAKAYAEARREPGASELIDRLVSSKPQMDRERMHSAAERREHALGHVREAVALVDAKATPEEAQEYRRFILALAERVAAAHKEGGEPVSDAERAAIADIDAALGGPAE